MISRREYKKLKKELLAQLEEVEEKQPAIEFFELNDPSKFDQSNELDRRPAVVEEGPSIDILAATDEPPAPTPPAPHTAPPPPPAPAVEAAPTEPAPADHAVSGLAPVDTSVNPLALGGAPSRSAPQPAAAAQPAAAQPAAASETSEASSTAAELLARLKADQPIQSQFSAAPVGLDIDPFASPTSDLVAPPPQVQAEVPVPTSLTPPASMAPPAPSAAPAPLAPTPMNPAPAPARPKSEPWSPPTPPPRGSNLDSIGNENTSAAAQVPLAPAPVETTAPVEAAAPFEAATPFDGAAPLGASPFGDAAPESDKGGEENHTRRKADTDESGQWIPPSLRGMATPDERDPLPKRRS